MNRRGWRAEDIPDLRGRRAIVTGGNSGIGYVTVRELARRGAAVTLAARHAARGQAAAERIRRVVPGATVSVGALDMASLASIRAFAAAADWPLDILVNNAGVMAVPRRRLTEDGFELQFGTNHLGHFALTGLLLPALLRAPAPVVVTVASLAHRRGRIDFDDLQSARTYDPWKAYGRSKLANLMFGLELQRHSEVAGARLRSIPVHPGVAHTNIVQAGPRLDRNWRAPLMELVFRIVGQSSDAGALPLLQAATQPDLPGGIYLGPGGLGGLRGRPTRVSMRPAARDRDVAARLWDESARLTDVTYDWNSAR